MHYSSKIHQVNYIIKNPFLDRCAHSVGSDFKYRMHVNIYSGAKVEMFVLHPSKLLKLMSSGVGLVWIHCVNDDRTNARACTCPTHGKVGTDLHRRVETVATSMNR